MIELMIAVPCPRCDGKGHLVICSRPAYTETRDCPRCDRTGKVGKPVPLASVLACITAQNQIYPDVVSNLPLVLNEPLLQHELDRLSKAENATASGEPPAPESSRPDRK